MFTKLLKYDFMFSKTAFFALAALMLGSAILIKLVSLVATQQAFEWMFGITGIVVLVIVILATGTQVLTFFHKNFFDDAGYLMLTLPVTRGKLLASKIVVSMAWLVFMMIVGFFALFFFAWAADPDGAPAGFFAAFEMHYLITYFQIAISVLLVTVVVFLAITLSNSVFGRMRVPWFVAGIVAVVFNGVALFAGSFLIQRRSEFIAIHHIRHIYDDYGFVVGTYQDLSFGRFGEIYRETGLRIGRIPIGDTGAFIDIYLWGMILGMTALAVVATYFLLKKKVSLA